MLVHALWNIKEPIIIIIYSSDHLYSLFVMSLGMGLRGASHKAFPFLPNLTGQIIRLMK